MKYLAYKNTQNLFICIDILIELVYNINCVMKNI